MQLLSRGRFTTLLLSLPACLLLLSCAALIGPRQHELPLAKLQQSLDHRFPLNKRILGVLELQLSGPQLALLPDNDRVALSLDASVASPLMKQTWRGSLTLSGRLAIDAARNAVFLREASVDRLVINDVDEGGRRQFAKVASLVADQIVRDMPLYNFHPEDLRFAGVQFTPSKITTTASGIVVNFEPAK